MILPGEVIQYWIPRGDIGSYRTINIMKKIVNESLSDPLIVYTAQNIVSGCPGKDSFCHADRILNWIKLNTRFIRDPVGYDGIPLDLIHTPKVMIERIKDGQTIQIDCDDFSILAASLGKAVGLPAKFVILGFMEKNAPFTHVYTILKTGKKWFQLDLKIQYAIPRHLIKRKEFINV